MQFQVLGQMRAVDAGKTIRLGSPQQQAMLAVMLLRSGRAASMTELVDAIWGDDPPSSAAATVRTHAWRLRQLLGESRGAPRTLISVGDGYRLMLEPDDVDALHAERLAADAVRQRSAGRLPEADESVREALDLWHGEPLSGVTGPHADQQRRRLEELKLTLLEERFDLMIRQGAHRLAIAELGALVSAHPLREPFHALYIRALHAAGRLADALAAYHRLRGHLADELGVEPTRELRDLYQRLLADDAPAPAERPVRPVEPVPAPLTVTAAPPSLPSAAEPPEWSRDSDGPVTGVLPAPAQLPASPVDFTGRTAALDRLLDALVPAETPSSPPIAVITGMGGAGKTTLAVRAAHGVRASFRDGQLYADMRGTNPQPADPGVVLVGFLSAFGIAAQFLPESLEDRAALLRSMLDGRQVLMVLDNVHNAAQIEPLLPGSGGCAVLITSRSKLWGLPTSARVDLTGFEADEAITLLGRIVGPDRIAADPSAARDLVRSCGLLPLAIRVVASRLAARPSWGTASMSARLADERNRVTELRVGDLAVGAVFEMGYQQLSPAQAEVFRVLAAVCEPEIGLPAAAAVLGLDEFEVEDRLESLVDQSLLETPFLGRYRFHDLLRAFGRQQASAAERAGALERLLDFLLITAAGAFKRAVPGDALAARIEAGTSPGLVFEDLRAARDWVTLEAESIFSAVHAATRQVEAGSGNAGALLRTAVDLLLALTAFGPYVQRRQLIRAATAVAEAARLNNDDTSMARAHFLCGNFAVQSAKLPVAKEHLWIAERHCRETDDPAILFQILNDLGLIALFEHRYHEALTYFDEAIPLARGLGQRSGALVARVNSALAQLCGGDPGGAAAKCREALAELRAVEDHEGAAYTLVVLGTAAHRLGRYEEAVQHYTACLALCQALDLHHREAQAHYRLADTLHAMGRSVEAFSFAGRAVARCREIGAERDRAHALMVLARILTDRGRPEEAALRFEEAESIFQLLGLPDAATARQLREQGGVSGAGATPHSV